MADKAGCLFGFLRFLINERDDSDPADALPYQRQEFFFSKAERSFYEVLKNQIGPEFVVFAKVRVADILSIPIGSPKAQTWRNKIDRKHFDFVLCDPVYLRPVLVIELDDSSHDDPDRRSRDDFLDRALATARLPIIHATASTHYNPKLLADAIRTMTKSPVVATPPAS